MQILLEAVGVSWSPITDEADAEGGQINVSYERVGELDGDVVFRHAFTEPAANVLAVFDQLPAVTAGQLIDEPNIFGQTYATYEIAWTTWSRSCSPPTPPSCRRPALT